MNRLSVLTLNIWNRSGPWDARLAAIREGIRRWSPDLVGLQEVIDVSGHTQGHEIAEGLGYHTVFGQASDYGGGIGFGNAVLSRWPISRHLVFPLPRAASEESRCLLFAEIASPHGAIPFFVTHLNWKLHESAVREKQVIAIADMIHEHAPISGRPPILVGDLNASPEASEIRFLKGLQSLGGKSVYLADCFEHRGQGRGVTFDGDNNPFAAVYHEHPRRIDYVLVRGPDKEIRGKPLSAKVVFDEPIEGVFASDHYGVLAEVSY